MKCANDKIIPKFLSRLRTALGKPASPEDQAQHVAEPQVEAEDTLNTDMSSVQYESMAESVTSVAGGDASTDQVPTKTPATNIETETTAVTAEPTSDTFITVSEAREDPSSSRGKTSTRSGSKPESNPESNSASAATQGNASSWHSTNTATATSTTPQQMKPDRTLLIAHFPRECYENDDVRVTLGAYGSISRINLISEPETKKPKCYGFVEFSEHRSALAALEASQNGQVVLYDQRNHPWHVKAEWTRAYNTFKATNKKDSDLQTAQESFEKSSTWNQSDRKYPGGPMAPARTLLIAYFPREATKDEITRCLSKHGNVTRVHLILEKDTKKPKCYGFVEFNSTEDASAVLAATEGGAVTMVDARDHMWHLRAERVRAFDRNGPSPSLLGSGKHTDKKGKRILGQDPFLPGPPPMHPSMNAMAPAFPPPMACAPPPGGFPNPRLPPYGLGVPAPSPGFNPSLFAPGLAPPEHLTNPSGPPSHPSPSGSAIFHKEVAEIIWR